MSRKESPVADLAALRQRLTSGIYPVMRRSRDSATARDREALARPWPDRYRAALHEIRSVPWDDRTGPAEAIRALCVRLRSERDLLLTVLLAPVAALGHIETLALSPHTRVVDSWIGAYWLAEAAADATACDLPAEAGFGVGEAGLLKPLACRLRFLVASEPMRSRGRDDAWWRRGGLDEVFGGSGLLGRALGEESWDVVASRCQEARQAWLDCLNAYQSYAYLSQATPAELEQELRWLVFQDGQPSRPLTVSGASLSQPASLNAADIALIEEITERHLLPRFDLRSVIALALYGDGRRSQVLRRVLALAALAAGSGVVAATALLWVHAATWVAAGCFLLIGAGVAAFGSRWAAPWLLRMPAAAAIGVIALVSFLPAGWLNVPLAGWSAATALAVAAFGYLVVELRNHGVSGRALTRSLAVAVIGAVQSLMVALIGMVAIAPAFAVKGQQLARVWSHPTYGHAGMVLLLAACWCLAVGVFSQILWDDRPITAPLAHVSWRSARP